MDVGDWLAICVLLFGGSGFWFWIRKLSVQLAALQKWADLVEKRCDDRREDMKDVGEKIGKVHGRIDDLHKCVAEKDSETAKAVGRLEGTVRAMSAQLGGRDTG